MSDRARVALVVYAKDVTRMAEFYAAVLPVSGVRRDEDHVTIDTSSCQVVVLAIPTAIAQDIEITSPPSRRTDTPLKFVFPVDSIARSRAAVAGLGGQVDSPEHEWLYDGDRVCDGHDPEGNVLQLRERLA